MSFKEIYGVWGNPIAHSQSPSIHSLFASQSNKEIDYKKLEAPIEGDEFEKALKDFFKFGGKGCNITAPFKERAFAVVYSTTERCAVAGSCNTIKLVDGKLLGDNTDGYGLTKDLQDLCWLKPDSKILILGSGGVVAGILSDIFNILEKKQVAIANRTEEKLIKLANRFEKLGEIKQLKLYDEIDSNKFDLIINTIPNFSVKLLPSFKISNTTKYYDLSYNLKSNTLFISSLFEINEFCEVSDGLGMLINQAAEAYKLWFGNYPDTNTIADSLRGSSIAIR